MQFLIASLPLLLLFSVVLLDQVQFLSRDENGQIQQLIFWSFLFKFLILKLKKIYNSKFWIKRDKNSRIVPSTLVPANLSIHAYVTSKA